MGGWGIVVGDAVPHCLFGGNVAEGVRAGGFARHKGGEHAPVFRGRGSRPSRMVGPKGERMGSAAV